VINRSGQGKSAGQRPTS